MFQRKLFKDLSEHLQNKQISLVTGMRRTGKTTLLKQLQDNIASPNKIYIDLERLDNRDLFSEKNYETILAALSQKGLNFQQKAYILIDEIQLFPNIPSVLKYLYDNYNIKFIVTGSSSYYIKNLFTESLAGRKKIFELFPLDFGEFLTFKRIDWQPLSPFKATINRSEYERLKRFYEEFIEYGGFPEVVLAKKVSQKKDLLQDIISSYINIDVKSMADFHDQRNLYNLIKLLAARAGSRLDYSKISRMAGISRITTHSYIDFLEKTYIVSRQSVFTSNIDREIVKAQKIYFCDNGLLGILAEVSGGAKFENAVYNQLRHFGEIKYYALKSGREVDFILDGKVALEAKETPISSDLNGLAEIARLAGVKKTFLIGRKLSPTFKDFIWGGDLR